MLAGTDSIKIVAEAIRRESFAVVPSFLDRRAVRALADECRTRAASGQLTPASIGHGAERIARADIRGDRTKWFDADDLTPAQREYWDAMDAMRVALNRELLLGLDELEAHFAMYAPGTTYARHRDAFHDDAARVLSSVLYLNDAWTERDGGALRMHFGDEKHLDVYPSAGTLVVFLSAEIEHEVLAAKRERLSVAGWFRRRA